MSQLESLKKISLVDHVCADLGLTRSSPTIQILCPFHNDTNASCVVYPANFYCFSCQAHGDIIDYEMKKGRMSFREAVAKLSRQYKVSTSCLGVPPRSLLERYREAADKIPVSALLMLLTLRPGPIPPQMGIHIHHTYGERDHLKVIREILALPDSKDGRARAIDILERCSNFYDQKTRRGKVSWYGGIDQLQLFPN